jgi:hypothetical protein
MSPRQCHMLGRNPTSCSRATSRVRTPCEQISGCIDMQPISGLRVAVNFDIDGMMQQRETLMFLVDVDSSIEEIAERLQVFHLYGTMSWRHISH